MRFCDAEIGEQQGSGFGLHRAAAVGMQGELAGGDIMLDDGVVEQGFEQRSAFSIGAACTALGLSRASLHRRQAFRRQPLAAVRPRPTPMRALVAKERQVVLDLLREPRFVDLAPAEVYASLLDQGVYLCSIRTMYRVLAEHDEVRERRRQLRRPVYQKPELLAEGPNQVWSWDITKLMGPAKWSYFYLYVIIDIFSRRIVAWCIAGCCVP